MRGSFAMTARRRVSLVAVGALLAVGAGLGSATGSAAGTAGTATGDAAAACPSRASSNAVMAALGVHKVPAEIVILVDISLSMAPGENDLFSTVRDDVLGYLGNLEQQDSQDLVGVILFGAPSDNQEIDPGPPNPHIYLPTAPSSQWTDFGYAFQQAVQMLSDSTANPSDIKAGGVVLLSDGEPSVPLSIDPAYGGNGFGAPGWKKLRAQVQNLPVPVTAYDVPLANNAAYTANQDKALAQAFSSVQQLPSGMADLSKALNLATLRVQDSEVARAAKQDIGQGVQVRWSGLRGIDGRPLNLASHQAEVMVTVTATTQKVPLSLSGLSVTPAGLPVQMSATLPTCFTLAPGQSHTLPVLLRWHSQPSGATLTGGPQTRRGTLTLHATVSSPFTPALRSTFGDTAFHAGGIQGAVSPVFPVLEQTRYDILLLVGLLLLVLLVLALIGFGVDRARLRGVLTVRDADGRGDTIALRRWRKSTSTAPLIGKPGRIIVHGHPVRRRMKVHTRIHKRPHMDKPLWPGGDVMLSGLEIKHRPRGVPADGAAPTGTVPEESTPAESTPAGNAPAESAPNSKVVTHSDTTVQETGP